MEVSHEDIGKIRDKVDGLTTQTNELDSKVTNLEKTVGGLDSKVTNLEKTVGGLDSKVTNLEKTVGALDSKVSQVQNDVSNLSQQMTHFDEKLTQKLEIFTEKIEGSETRIVNRLWPMVVGVVAGSVTIGVTVLGLLNSNSNKPMLIMPPPSYYQMPAGNQSSPYPLEIIPPQTQKAPSSKPDSSEN